MNVALILAGGTGTRLGGDIPKQYLLVNEKPVIVYCLETFENNQTVDEVLIVAANEWQESIKEWIDKYHITKFKGFAEAGSSRQHSILNGMNKALELGAVSDDKILIHDAARPNVSDRLIDECFSLLVEYDGVMPVIPVKDTIYLSKDGKEISDLLNRDQLFAGQAPESFRLGKYHEFHKGMGETDLDNVRGSSELAYKNGMKIRLIKGDEHNYKITTLDDLKKFQLEIKMR